MASLNEDAAREEDGDLAESAEVLRAAMTVVVALIGRTAAEAERQIGHHGGDDIPGGLDTGRHEPQAAGDEPRAELERDQQRRGGNGHQRGARLTLSVARRVLTRRGE